MSPKFRLVSLLALLFSFCLLTAQAQTTETPLTSQEIVKLIYQLPAHPELKEKVVEEIRSRGIGFPLTDGLRSLVATKSGNDALLRRTLEEAERRRLNPVASALPPEAEGLELLAKSRVASLAAADAMPDFIVKQLVTRYVAIGGGSNWQVSDRLTVAVSYQQSKGEAYRLLAVNGMTPREDVKEGFGYEQVGGAISAGEYVSMMTKLFDDASRTDFKLVDTDTLHNRHTLVYEYEVKQENSQLKITAVGVSSVITGYRGRIWIDRENSRILRMEQVAAGIPADFPITAASRIIDYDWVTIADKQYLLPSHSEVFMTQRAGSQIYQSRNDIRFRGYQKFGAELKVIDEIDASEFEKTPGQGDEPPKMPQDKRSPPQNKKPKEQ